MKSWKTRLLMMFTMLALILAVSVPGMANIEIECDSDDGGYCEEHVYYETEYTEDETIFEDEAIFEGEIVEDPYAVESAEDCYPFCGVEYWPW